MMQLLFIGYGSIAKRHIRNIQDICSNRGEELYIDVYRHSQAATSEKTDGIRTIYTVFENVPDYYDVIFITNPTNLHVETLQRFHEKGKHFFIEKPATSLNRLNEVEGFTPRRESVYYVAAPLRYQKVIQYLKSSIDLDKVISARCISSSYLPEWRPGQDYRDTYSAHRDMGGGVSIDLIHEWDYLVELFGWPAEVKCMIGKKSSLEIDSDDYAIYIAEYKERIVELHLDYFGRKTIREIQLMTDEDTITANLITGEVEFEKAGETIHLHEDRDEYQKRELEFFLALMENKENYNGLSHACNVLKLTQGELRKNE